MAMFLSPVVNSSILAFTGRCYCDRNYFPGFVIRTPVHLPYNLAGRGNIFNDIVTDSLHFIQSSPATWTLQRSALSTLRHCCSISSFAYC